MRALVLGGGSMKGAFQVGAIQAVMEDGFQPDMIYGISVGALNTTFLVNESGQQLVENDEVNWKVAGRKLLEFWIHHITHPQDISTLRSRMLLGVNTLRSRFDGILDPSPLHNLIRGHINQAYIEASTLLSKVGAVNIQSGEIKYVSKNEAHFMDFVNASSSIPMLMPTVEIDKEFYLDGGMREVAPVRQAIEDGATEIVLIACHSPHLYQAEDMNAQNLITLIERVRDITVNQIVNSNIQWAESFVDRSILRGKHMSLTVIRPSAPLVLDLQHFTSEDISRLLVEGYKEALHILKKESKL
ncbi:NTE family protein [Dyadobacter jejuensis]|uniref:NTE family protein n=1 Tax=Dyadobacter jejuensis TaxID=1082580 RepID=A0A316AMG5_9BACT|nr:patatin-like phospholipase family protein [Dyadobacter jejuensis]PWJ58766.1 NTE family protein [Dyadobacter jejuensis]